MANDIIDINVTQTIETVEITVTPNLTTVNINQITDGGGGVTNLSTTQTDINFSINSDTGNDAVVPLGNGVLAGATLNDYTTPEKTKLAGIATGAEVNVNADWNATTGDAVILNKPIIPSISGLATTAYVDTQDALKVDKITGKGLSTEDYTTIEKTKLAGIATGAEVNVNSDWNATTGDAVILNKPIIPSAVTQTSQITNNGADGINPFITALDIPTTGQASSLVREVKNMTGAILIKGTVVYVSGANGNKPLVSKALATTDALSSRTFGLLQSDILNNGLGNCVIIGDLSGLDTSAFAEGAQLYLSGVTAGTFTASKILAPTHLVYIGKVTRSHPTQGQIEVGIQNGYELEEVHDVQIITPTNNQGLFYEIATDLWKNKSIATVLGFSPANDSNVVHLTGTETISGNKTLTGNTIINGNTTASPLTINAGFPAVDDGFSSIILNTFLNSAQNAFEVNYTDSGVTVNVANITRVGSAYFGNGIGTPTINISNQTALTIASFDASKNLVSLSTATYPNLTELSYAKGVTSAIQTQLNGKQPIATVLTNTTASFTTALETKLAGIATGANVGVVPNTAITGATKTKITYDSKGLVTAGQDLIASDIPNIAQSQVTSLTTDLGLKQNKSLSAYSVVANSTNASANATEFTFRKWDLATYSGSLSWAQTAPTTILGASYSGQQVGNMVSINISVVYSTAGTGNLQVTLPLPSDFPTPLSPTGFTAGLDVLAYGTGQIMANTSQTVATGARGCFLRRNTANNGYEFFLNVSVATAAKVVMLNLTYQTS